MIPSHNRDGSTSQTTFTQKLIYTLGFVVALLRENSITGIQCTVLLMAERYPQGSAPRKHKKHNFERLDVLYLLQTHYSRTLSDHCSTAEIIGTSGWKICAVRVRTGTLGQHLKRCRMSCQATDAVGAGN